MSDDRQPPSAPRPERGDWGSEYDAETTSFLPMTGGVPSFPGYPDYSAGVQPGADPLAAPGHGYTPPDFADQPPPEDPSADPGPAGPYGTDGSYSPYGPYTGGDAYGTYPGDPGHGAPEGYGPQGGYGTAEGGLPPAGYGTPDGGYRAEGGYPPQEAYRPGGLDGPDVVNPDVPGGGVVTPAATTDPAAPGEWSLPFVGVDAAPHDPYQVGGGPSPFDAPSDPGGSPEARPAGLAAALGQGAAAARAGAQEARARQEPADEGAGTGPTIGDPWSVAPQGPGAAAPVGGAEPGSTAPAEPTAPQGTPPFGTDWNAVPGGGGSGQWEIPQRGSEGAVTGEPATGEPATASPAATSAPETAAGLAAASGEPRTQRRPLANPDQRPAPENDQERAAEPEHPEPPVDPSAQADPSDPADPVDPSALVDPVDPVDPGDPEPREAPEAAEPKRGSVPLSSVIPRVPSVPGRPRANVPAPDPTDPADPGEGGGERRASEPSPTAESEPVASATEQAADPGTDRDPAASADPATASPVAPEPVDAPSPADPQPSAPGPAPVDGEHPHTSYALHVNGVDRQVIDAWIGESLLYVLRERLGLAGAKDGCAQGECGACSVQVDGRLVASCLVPAALTVGTQITTVEGLGEDGAPSDVQRALAECGAVQCGFCVPGMVMTLHDLLEGNHAPSELEARKAISGNLCRCSGYRGVLDAVRTVAAERAARAAQEAAEVEESAPASGSTSAPHIPQQAGPYGRPSDPARGLEAPE